MNFSQLHELLRIEVTRRIDRGQLTGTLLARQTGLRASHLSNFIRRKRRLSLPALDRVLAAQMLSVEDLLPESRSGRALPPAGSTSIVPLVSPATAMHSPIVDRRSILQSIPLPEGALDQLRPRRTIARRDWQRFVALRLTSPQAAPMEPDLSAGSVIVLDRHYNSLVANDPSRPNIYAVNAASSLVFRYLSHQANRLILRPRAPGYSIELMKIAAEESPSTPIVGRVCIAIAQL
ncbi:MAG TPA: hypothetical protein VFW25_07235 [Silvibacterium sp.]|nr:hypothetical protein [Silvibacterium sp.]